MKRCPQCKRTYASDDFTFCLDDGALLSAPYEQGTDKPTDQVRRPAPPTEVLPAAQRPTVPSPRNDRNGTPALQTLTAPTPPAKPASERVATTFTSKAPARKTALRIVFLAAPLVLLIALVVGGLFAYESRCPDLTVTCSAGDNLVGCVTGGESWTHLIVSRSMTWKSSKGSLRTTDAEGVVFETPGLAGQEITVTATYQSWWCTTSAYTTFVAK